MNSCPECSEEIPESAEYCEQCHDIVPPDNNDIEEQNIMCVYPMWLKHRKEWIWGILLLPVFGIGLVSIISAIIKRYSKKCIITNKKVILETGILSKTHDIVHINNIRSFRIEQTAWGRLFNCGDVILSIPGQSVTIEKIHKPHCFVDIINQYKS